MAYKSAIIIAVVAALYALEYTNGSLNINATIVLVYVALRYWHEGIPVEHAWKDVMYFWRDNRQNPPLYWMSQFKQADVERDLSYQPVLETDDHITKVCKAAMHADMTQHMLNHQDPFPPRGIHNLNTGDNMHPEERTALFVKTCRETYATLNPEQRILLDAWMPTSENELNATTPIQLEITEEKVRSGMEERIKAAEDRPPLDETTLKTKEELGDFGELYHKFGLRPSREEVIPVSKIEEYVRLGKVARFDATELLGKELFNLSILDVARLHQDTANPIPVYRQSGALAPGKSGWESLGEFADRVVQWQKANLHYFPEFRPWAQQMNPDKFSKEMEATVTEPVWWLKWYDKVTSIMRSSHIPSLAALYKGVRIACLQCAVNTRRLPNLPMPPIEKALGNPPWLERAWSLFWLGAVADCWHYDDPDNLLIAVHDEIYVSFFDSKDSDLLRAHGDRGCWSIASALPQTFTNTDGLSRNEWVKKLKYYTVKLEPGMGLVIPSRAYHSLVMPRGTRLLLNSFLMPKFNGLKGEPGYDASSYSPKHFSPLYSAVRHLKSSTIYKIWDTKKIGGWFEFTKLELL